MQVKLLCTVFMAFTAFYFTPLQAQTEGKKHEVGIQLNGINFDGMNSFSGFYKKQLSENKYRRLRFFTGNLATGTNDGENFFFNLSLGAAIGWEKRKMLDPKLEFYRGPEFAFGVGLQSIRDNNSFYFRPSIGYVLGLQHSFNEHWAINIETIPNIGLGVVLLPGDADQYSLEASIRNTVSLGVVRKF